MSTIETRGRGRPRTFDEEAVLDALTTLFWERGYEATSMADITEAAGLNKSSLYNTFGSKQDLFDRVLERYVAARVAMLGELVGSAGSGIAALHAFVEMVREETQSTMGRHGCLAVNTSTELGGTDESVVRMSERYRAMVRDTVRELVDAAASSGEIDPDHVDHHTAMLVAFMLGVSVTARSGAGPDEIAQLIDGAHATVDSWAT